MNKLLCALCLTSVTTVASAQDYKWDIGLKAEHNDNTGINFEVRRHLNNAFSFTAGASYHEFYRDGFGYIGYYEETEENYYQGTQTSGSLTKMDVGAQMRLPFWNEMLYVHVGLNGGQRYYNYTSTIFTSDSDSSGSLFPYSSAGNLSGEPTDQSYNYSNWFIGGEKKVGIDVPLGKRFLFTSSVGLGLRYQPQIISLHAHLAAGLRYRFGTFKEG